MSSQRELILSILTIILVVIFGIKQLSGIIVECKDNFATKTNKTATIEDLRKKEETIQLANEQLQKKQDVLKPFYKPEFQSPDSVASFGGMFEDIIDYIKINGLMLRSIEYNINPEQDLIFKSFASAYNVCEVKLFLVGTYPQLQTFFNDLYAYPYYLNVTKIDIKSYEPKPQYLLVNLSIDLYSKK